MKGTDERNLQRNFTRLKLEFDPVNCDFTFAIHPTTARHDSEYDPYTFSTEAEEAWVTAACGSDTAATFQFIQAESGELCNGISLCMDIRYPLINIFGESPERMLERGIAAYILTSSRSCMSAIWALWVPGSVYTEASDEELYTTALTMAPLREALRKLARCKRGLESSETIKVPLVTSNKVFSVHRRSINPTVYKTISLEMYYMIHKYVSNPSYRESLYPANEFMGALTREYSEDPAVRIAQIRKSIKHITDSEIVKYGCDILEDFPTAIFIWVLNNLRTSQAQLIYKSVMEFLPKTDAEGSEAVRTLLKGMDMSTLESEGAARSSFKTHDDRIYEGTATDSDSKDENIAFVDDGVCRRYGSYKIEVNKTPAIGSGTRSYNTYLTKYAGVLGQFGRRLRDLRTYNTGGKMPGQLSGKLDRKNLYRYRTTPKIFYNNTYKQREQDLAIGVLLDESGSMCGNGIMNGRAALILIHEVLTNLHINHCIAGHTSSGEQHHVTINPYVWFKENKHYTPNKCTALATIEAKCGNCDSGALYFMEQELLRTKNKDKLCLIFSDGSPTECTEAELKQQVKHMEDRHIKVIGIGVNFPSIARYYNDHANGTSLHNMLNIVCDILYQYILEQDTKKERW